MHTDQLPPRLLREHKTFEAMLTIYCRAHHEQTDGLCSECADLFAYAEQRLAKCPFGAQKPTCANCPIHCYRKDMRARTREMMRYSGPRMLLRHPVLAIMHLLDGQRKAPTLSR